MSYRSISINEHQIPNDMHHQQFSIYFINLSCLARYPPAFH